MNDARGQSGWPVLLFDLGGVIVDVATPEEMRADLQGHFGGGQLRSAWQATDAWYAFEVGTISPQVFARSFLAEYPLRSTPEDFLARFESWNRRLVPGIEALLAGLRPRYRLAALSNTNELHWRRLAGEFAIPTLFERVFTSHELGLRKPDPRVYECVLRELQAEPAQVTFFDDSEANVEAARQVGMAAYRVEGLPELRECLLRLGCLSA